MRAGPFLAAVAAGLVVLSGARGDDAGVKELTGLKGLLSLELRGTKVTDAGAAAFQAARPKCKVGR